MSAAPATRYAAAADLTPDALLRIWRSIPPDRQEAIGLKVLGTYLAELVADDDGLVSTGAERDAASAQAQDDFQELFEAVQAALPDVLWFYPEGYAYEAHDRHGSLLGIVEHVGGDRYRFCPASPRFRLGRTVDGAPLEALPRWVRKAVENDGWFGAILPDGRRYPDAFRALSATPVQEPA